MLNNDEVPRGVPPQPGRRPPPTRFQDNRIISPSTSYNYNSNAGYGQNGGFGGQQPRRRIERFKREPINYNERMIRQNDSIIRLLKEIRDRLPTPPPSAAVTGENDQVALEENNGALLPESNDVATEDRDQDFNGSSENAPAPEGQVEPQSE